MYLHSATSSQIAVKRKTKATKVANFFFSNLIYLFPPKSKCIAG